MLAGGASHRLRQEKKNQPRRGDGIDLRFSLSPCGAGLMFLGKARWLAPPANLRQPSRLNTKHVQRLKNAGLLADAKQVPPQRGFPTNWTPPASVMQSGLQSPA